ncbi:twinfilin [Schistocerca nitens]|uniref:twinfilin n=1 Tax=Schistocerca nitens TaxID=7011 RepID=UPI0021177A0D|nr:twinfilin [Schistocerca nitens]
MSHQTGIRANDALKKFFGKCKGGNIRVFKVSIENEQLSLAKFKEAVGTWQEDFDNCILPLVEDEQPSYVLYRLDSKNTSGYEWLLISWSPDNSPIRQKMLYASTKATLKQEFGSGQIKEELHGTTLEDITLNGFMRHKQAAKEPAPLTTAEEELAELKRTEVGVSVDSRHQTLSGVAFPITKEARQAICGMLDDTYNYVQLRIDLDEEKIHLASAGNVPVAKLSQKVPTDSARYHLYNFKHTHEGDYMETIVFIYSMPGYSCSIKERMLYSSCKGPLLETIETEIGLSVTKKMEIDGGDELTEAALYDAIHPKTNLHQPKFAKPKGPPNRGAKRLTRTQQAE